MLEWVSQAAGMTRGVAERARALVGAARVVNPLQAWTLHGTAALLREWRRMPLGPTLVGRLHAVHHPDRPAVIDDTGRLTWAEFDDSLNRLGNGLAGLGVRAGDRVAVMMRNCRQFVQAQWAIARMGAVLVQIGYRLKAGEVGHVLGHSGAAAVLYQAEFEDVIAEACGAAGVAPRRVRVPDEFDRLLAAGHPGRPPARAPGAKGGVMIYTSGTTGKPKGAARGFDRLFAFSVLDMVRQVGIDRDERHLVACPLYHSAAPIFTALVLGLGGTVVITEHFDAEKALALVERERITSAFLVPTMLGRLAALPPETRDAYDLSSLRWLMSGAAPLLTATAGQVLDAFGPVLYNFYGATETGFVTLALPADHLARPGTIGRRLAGTDIQILDEKGRAVPRGGVGELWVRNRMQIEGYFHDRGATDEATRAGFFSVGDLGWEDEDGYYYLADRKTDMVISGGVNIYPLEIEQALSSHPAIAEAAVIGVPDPEWGESLKAFVVLRPGARLTAEEVSAHCRRRLADFKCPRRVDFLDALPRNPTGKVLKRELRGR